MTNGTQYKGSLGNGGLDTSRGPSVSVWTDCPIDDILTGFIDGVVFFDDFLNGPRIPANTSTEGVVVGYGGGYRGLTGTATAVANEGGEWGGTVNLAGTADNDTISFRTANCPFQIARGQGRLWFECRVKSSDISDNKHGIFVGLMQDVALTAIIPITAAGAIADTNLVGFHRLEGDGDQFDTIYKADGVAQVTVQADAATIAADSYVKLGMIFEPKNNTLSFYRNGVKLANTYTVPAAAGTDFPNDVRLGLVIALVNATGTAPGTGEIDWWRCVQLAP